LKKYKDYRELEDKFVAFPKDFKEPIFHYLNTAIPIEFRNTKFDMFDDALKPVLQRVVLNLLNNEPVGLLLMGDIGVGKTAALWWLSNIYLTKLYIDQLGILSENLDFDYLRTRLSAIEFLKTPFYLSRGCEVKTAFQHTTNMRFNFQNNSEYKEMGEFYKYTNMFIDDFGVELDDAKGWNRSLWDEFIDYRWRWSKPLFITTNFMLDDLLAWKSWARVVDRLVTKKKMIRIQVKGRSKR